MQHPPSPPRVFPSPSGLVKSLILHPHVAEAQLPSPSPPPIDNVTVYQSGIMVRVGLERPDTM